MTWSMHVSVQPAERVPDPFSNGQLAGRISGSHIHAHPHDDFCWSTGVVSTPICTILAVAFFLNSFSLPKKPSSPVVFGFPSHSSSCCVMRFVDGSTCRVISELTSFSMLPAFILYNCDREIWTEGGVCGVRRGSSFHKFKRVVGGGGGVRSRPTHHFRVVKVCDALRH